MNGKDIMNAMSNISDKYISEFADTSKFKPKQKFYLSPRFYGSIAAALILGIGAYIAVPKLNNSDFSFSNNVNRTSENSSPQTNHSDDFNSIDNIQNAEEKDTSTVKNRNEGIENAGNQNEQYDYADKTELFSIKVYASENSESTVELTPDSPVKIKGDFNPLSSSSKGLGIEFEITCPTGGLTLQADNGHFLQWDKNSGAVTNYGAEYFANGVADIFWTFYSNSFSWDKTTSVSVLDSSNTVISVIKITGDESTHTFSATLENME